MRNASTAALALTMAGLVAACGSTAPQSPEGYDNDQQARIRDRYGTVFSGEDQKFTLYSSEDENGADGATSFGAIAVNPFLWRASLETIDFMPLNQTDPFGGVIITDWYSPPETPDERFKLNVYVLGTSLRADGIKVAVFRQTRTEGGWVDAEVDPDTATGIEDNILARARELRVASVNAGG